jgi:hypothetical protein
MQFQADLLGCRIQVAAERSRQRRLWEVLQSTLWWFRPLSAQCPAESLETRFPSLASAA